MEAKQFPPDRLRFACGGKVSEYSQINSIFNIQMKLHGDTWSYCGLIRFQTTVH